MGRLDCTEELRDKAMNEARRAHFAQSQELIDKFKGRKIKTIGDSFLGVFTLWSVRKLPVTSS